MSQAQILATYTPTAGFYSADRTSVPQNALCEGSYNVFLGGANNQRIFKGLKLVGAGARTLCKIISGYAGLSDTTEVQGLGSIFNFVASSLFWIGEGTLSINGTATSFVATSNLQLSPKPYTQAFTAGMAQPDAPILEARTPEIVDSNVGLMTGLYSFKIARVRSLTGGRSIASPTSAPVLFTGQAARLTFPLADSNGQDRWAVFSTKAGFGGTGLHYLVQEIAEADLITIDGVDRSYEFDVVDSDLLPVLAYIDDYPPPAGSFGGRLENYVVVIGAYDNAIASSIRNFPESFNPDHLAFLPKEPTAVLADQMGSYIYISCESSVHALSVMPSLGNPMILQTVFSDTGVHSNSQWCSMQGAIFAFVARQHLVTMDNLGRPNGQFALPIAKKIQNWEVEDVVMAAVPDLNSIFVCNKNENDAFLFNVLNLQWSSPARCSDFADGEIVSAVVVDRRLKICFLNNGSFHLYEFDEQPNGSSHTNFKIVSPDIQNPNGRLNIINAEAVFNASEAGSYQVKVVPDFTDTVNEKVLTHTVIAKGMTRTPRSRWYMPRKIAMHVEFSGSQSNFVEDTYLGAISVHGTTEESVVLG